MQIDLSGKHAIITGSTAGIGFAIAQALANAGANVVVTGRTQGRVDDAIAALKNATPNAKVEGVAADLGTVEGCQTLIEKQPSADILINNVGIFAPQDFFDVDDATWQQFFDVNVMSAVRLSRHYAQGMRERDWGRIQFVSSESGINIPSEMVHYGMTKSALLSVSRGLAKVLSGTQVTVNAILPGPTRSEGVLKMIGEMAKKEGISQQEMEERFVKENRPSSIIQRLATPEEVASMSVYAASPQASATTGAALRVEGGIVDTLT
ncbi:SDR family oxidoreductase [Halomonas sp. FeN2]|uniref:SDR family oxidoreductase n=1 Tax=Vreelandella neptunia TaxID=115551 RepID=A0ABZ0YJ45_9GAMM|nr:MULTISPECIES: SDR family oxidoreductase [Halomonas]TDW00217.1 NAD(P)-dependent dehydrogenase (short-subunit alcohol dehydrogenase family) [Halomonas alkaliantarctica]MBF59451.1 oxidoreductase [Halomonas sp.]MDN3561181.1 SDR family oxidoreductase [Halomonas neptunia]UBR50806.1 SDR family oxidoreductase [Halomonas sp. FeN2]WQH11315.1 SDR family oxidoreductase [Halomonas neptunia]|tara:strand:+ start:381 stop:1175 length:795 start_codon:yes stop_codon:yes gene_type:complete